MTQSEAKDLLKPGGGGKTSLSKLGLESERYAPGSPLADVPTHYHFDEAGLVHDFLWRPQPGADTLFVLFSGDADRALYTPPVFQRWSWAPRFPGHCLYFADPTLGVSPDLGLAWYAGTPDYDPLKTIHRVIAEIAQQAGIPAHRVVAYGSSGGGFAALRLLGFGKEFAAVTINPQINVYNFHERKVKMFLDACFPGRSKAEAMAEFAPRLDLLSSPHDFAGRRIVYAQNVKDKMHHDKHFLPFMAHVGGGTQPTDGPLRTVMFDNPDGHAKAEAGNPEVFSEAMQIVQGWLAA